MYVCFTCAYWCVTNNRFSETLACFIFLKHPFWDSSFCLIIDEIYFPLIFMKNKTPVKSYLDSSVIMFCLTPSRSLLVQNQQFNQQKQPPEVFCKKGVLRNFASFTGRHLCQSLFFNKVAGGACNFVKKETLAQMFSCEFCEISKYTFFLQNASGGCFWKYLCWKVNTYSFHFH